MSLRLLAGLLVAAAIFLSPLVSLVLLKQFPPPDITVQLSLCAEGETWQPDKPCLRGGPRAAMLRERSGPDGTVFERRVSMSSPDLTLLAPGMPTVMGMGVGAGGHPEHLGRFRGLDVEGMAKVRSHFLWINLASLALTVGLAVLVATLALRRPFRAVLAAIGDVERGSAPPAWAFSGPTELRKIGLALTQLGAQLRGNLQERELMLAGLSHDLRSPLARIQAAIELRGDDDERWQDTLRDVQEIDHIVGQCIDFARDGQDEPQQLQSLDGVVAAALQGAQRAGVDLQLGADWELLLRAHSLTRAIRNLIDNARRHGAEPIRVSTRISDQSAVLRVEDGGTGISPPAWAALRKPFARGNRARNPGGAGLGLAIVQRVADLHQGRLEITPRSADQPFAVELHLPLAARADQSAVA